MEDINNPKAWNGGETGEGNCINCNQPYSLHLVTACPSHIITVAQQHKGSPVRNWSKGFTSAAAAIASFMNVQADGCTITATVTRAKTGSTLREYARPSGPVYSEDLEARNWQYITVTLDGAAIATISRKRIMEDGPAFKVYDHTGKLVRETSGLAFVRRAIDDLAAAASTPVAAGSVILFEALGFRVTSSGNGAFYTLVMFATGRDVFLQGDDAAEFREGFDTADDITDSAISDHAKRDIVRAYF